MLNLSVVVVTWNRPQLLAHCLYQYRQQLNSIETECIVVSDGPDAKAAAIAAYYKCRYIEIPQRINDWGATPRDVGIAAAVGSYVVTWDDDNIYHPHAIDCLYKAASGFDIGVCQCVHWEGTQCRTIPPTGSTYVQHREVDAMCPCVRREVAQATKWATPPNTPYECDFRWLESLVSKGATTNFVPVVIGEHL